MMHLFTFPNLNKWSSPLLFLTLQGLIFAILLFYRWYKEKNVSDLLLGLLLAILCYHRTTYIIGFMDWYDTFRNTKINYFLIPMSFSVGPLLYLYVKSVTTSGFKLVKKHIWHFVLQIVYTIYRVVIFLYDASQSGFDETQNGYLMENLDWAFVYPFYVAIENLQFTLYLAFTVQLFYIYRKKIIQFFSNLYKLELNWLRNFLAIYILLHVYNFFEIFIDEFIFSLHWTNRWWYHFVSALAIIYIGIKGYFTKTDSLKDLEFNDVKTNTNTNKESLNSTLFIKEKEKVMDYLTTEKVFLDPDLSLKSLSKKLNFTPARLSEVINSGFGLNFNDFINSFRVDEIKAKIKVGEHERLSLVAIAHDCGFNSKATFNRVFKKLSGMSPSQYADSLKTES